MKKTEPNVGEIHDAAFVRDTVMRAFDETQGGKKRDWTVAGPILTRRECLIFRAACDDFKTPLAVKIFRPGLTGAHVPRLQYDALLAYSDGGAGGSTGAALRVPRPYALIDDHRAVAMEWIDSPRTSQIILRKFYDTRARRRYVRQAGEWLRWFHEKGGIERAPFDARRRVDNIRAAQAPIMERRRQVIENDDFYLSCMDILETQARRIGDIEIEHAVIHADFTPNNLLQDENAVTGIDFIARERGEVTRDICRFLVYLDIYRSFLTSAAELRRHGCNRADYDCFMEGYGGVAPVTEDGNMPFLQYVEVMRRWTALKDMRAKNGLGPARAIEIYRLRRIAAHLSHALQDAAGA